MRKEFVCCIIEHTIKRSSVREESIIPAFSCCVCVCLFMLRGMIWRFGAPWMKVDLFKKSVSYACPWSRGRYNHSWDKTNEGLSSSWRITRQFNAARLDYWYWLMDDFNTNRYVYDFIWIYARRNARLADAVAGWSCKLLQAMNCLLPLHTYCTKSIQYQPVTNLLQHYFTWTEIQIDTFKTSETGKWNFYMLQESRVAQYCSSTLQQNRMEASILLNFPHAMTRSKQGNAIRSERRCLVAFCNKIHHV